MSARINPNKPPHIRADAARWRCALTRKAKSGAQPSSQLSYFQAAARHSHRAGDIGSRRRALFGAMAGRRRRGNSSARHLAAVEAKLLIAFLSSMRGAQESSERTLHKEVALGTAIGFFAALAGAWLAGGSLLVFTFATMSGTSIGALIGLLLWVGSNTASEAPVLPPAPTDARPAKANHPRHRP